MTFREGSLEAPTRHALDWRNPDFYDEASLNAELARIFDICHGCRRCVSLCNAFPTLFDLVDASESGEVDGVDKADYGRVVDQCYLCDVCYMTKCPYVPPHPWNVDFPHLMLRAKARKFVQGGTRWRGFRWWCRWSTRPLRHRLRARLWKDSSACTRNAGFRPTPRSASRRSP